MHSLRRAATVIAVAAFAVFSLSAQDADLRRFGLFIGANDGGSDRVTLRWAVSDAARLADVMSEVGGIAMRDLYLLEDPSADQLRQQLERISERVADGRGTARRTEFVFYYSGHSDESGLMLHNDHYTYMDLRQAIEAVHADVNIAILDSCASGAFTRLKGGSFIQPFLPDDGSEMTGHAFLTSSSADEASQESDTIGSSFFTHYLVSGLRGAADSDNDGLVTLDEAYAHARDATLGRTATTFAGPQHASFDFKLSGSGSLVLTNLQRLDSAIVFDGSVAGRILVNRSNGALVAELDKAAGAPLTVALPADSYVVTLRTDERDYQHQVDLVSGGTTAVRQTDFRVVLFERTRIRGDETPTTAPFVFSVLPGLGYGMLEADVTNLSVGLLTAAAYRVEGGMLAGLITTAGEDVSGIQLAGIGNHVAGAIRGFQSAGVYNQVSGDSHAAQHAGVFNHVDGIGNVVQTAGVYNIAVGGFNGVQTAGVFNSTDGMIVGAQIAGVYNTAGPVNGGQISLVNVAGNVNGAQVGLVNIGKTVRGTQIGLVNISEELYGIPIGLVNIIERGIDDVSLWWQEDQRTWLAVQNGSNVFYTLAYAGVRTADEGWKQLDGLSVGAGAGVRVQFRPFFVDADISYSRVSSGTDRASRFLSFFDPNAGAAFPTARVLGGIAFGDGLGWFIGASFDAESSLTTDNMGYFADLQEGMTVNVAGESLRLYPRFFSGFKL